MGIQACKPAYACRVLIFSQMVRALDIISDYMRLKGYQHQRLDGSTPATTRHQVRKFGAYTHCLFGTDSLLVCQFQPQITLFNFVMMMIDKRLSWRCFLAMAAWHRSNSSELWPCCYLITLACHQVTSGLRFKKDCCGAGYGSLQFSVINRLCFPAEYPSWRIRNQSCNSRHCHHLW